MPRSQNLRDWETHLAVEKPYTPYYGEGHSPSQKFRSPIVNHGYPSYSGPPSPVSDITRAKLSEIANRFVKAHERSSQSTIELAEKIKNEQRTKENAKKDIDGLFQNFGGEFSRTRANATQELYNLIDNCHSSEGREIVSTWKTFLTSYQPIMEKIWNAVISVLTGVINFLLMVWDGIRAAYETVKVYFKRAWDAIRSVFS